MTSSNFSKCWIWRSYGINIATFRVPRGLWYKKGPQKWAFQQILSRFMSCQLFFRLHWHRAQVLFTNRNTIGRYRDRSPRNAPLRVHFSKNVVRFAKSCDFQLYLACDSHRAISAAMRSLERHRSTHKRSFVQKTRFSSPFVCGTTPHATKPKVSTRTNWMCATNHISAHVQTRHTHSDLETLLRTFCNHSAL